MKPSMEVWVPLWSLYCVLVVNNGAFGMSEGMFLFVEKGSIVTIWETTFYNFSTFMVLCLITRSWFFVWKATVVLLRKKKRIGLKKTRSFIWVSKIPSIQLLTWESLLTISRYFIHSFTHLLIHSFTHSLNYSFTHSFIHSFTQLLNHSFTHSLT